MLAVVALKVKVGGALTAATTPSWRITNRLISRPYLIYLKEVPVVVDPENEVAHTTFVCRLQYIMVRELLVISAPSCVTLTTILETYPKRRRGKSTWPLVMRISSRSVYSSISGSC
jgi:hypothetical protein